MHYTKVSWEASDLPALEAACEQHNSGGLLLQGIVIPDDQGWFTPVPEFEVACVRSRPVSSLRVYYIYPFIFFLNL